MAENLNRIRVGDHVSIYQRGKKKPGAPTSGATVSTAANRSKPPTKRSRYSVPCAWLQKSRPALSASRPRPSP